MIHSLLSGLPELFEEDDDPDAALGATPPEHGAEAGSSSPSNIVVETGEERAIALDAPIQDSGEPAAEGETSEDASVSSSASSPPTEVETFDTQARSIGDLTPDPPDADSVEKTVEASTEQGLAAELRDISIHVPNSDTFHPDNQPPSLTEITSAPMKARVSLTTLLRQADALFERYPPSHPSLALRSIMGPQSVLFTWSEDASQLPDDVEAELMVLRPELIVLPPPPPPSEGAETDAEGAPEKQKEGQRRRRTLKKPKPRRRRTIHVGSVEVEQRKMLVAGAVLVLGVALAIYGRQVDEPWRHGTRGHFRTWSRGSIGGLKRIGGLMMNVGERLFDGLHLN
jgi:TBC1 domain family member 20